MKTSFVTTLLMSACLSVAAASAQPARSDRDFLRQAIRGDNSEMALGALAEQRAASPGVRRYGATLRRDHAQARRDAVSVARRYGVSASTALTPEARSERVHLMALRGRAFDREFVRYMIDDHHKDIDDFRHEARERGAAARLAERTLPHLEEHLRIAQSLRTSVGA